jgi:hypothetical protein
MGNGTHALCGAKTRSGSPCKGRAMKNGRCRMHGGKATGPKTPEGKAKAALNSRKHGAYIDKVLNDEEKEIYQYLHESTVEKYKLDEENAIHMATLHRACVTYLKIMRLDAWEMEREFEPYIDDSGATDQYGQPLLKPKYKYDESGQVIGESLGRMREIRWSKNTPPWETHFQNYMKLLGVDRASQIKQEGDQKNAQTVADGFAWLWGQKSEE